MNKDKLLKSKTFCMLPWTHMHLWPSGNTYPCCIWDSTKPLGNYNKESSLKDIWNSPDMKKLRLNMLNDEQSDGCKRCYELEKFGGNETLRITSNNNYSHKFELVEQTKDDGTVEKVQMSYLDIRFNNLCNLRCQTCGHDLSSAWYEDQIAMFNHPIPEKVISIDPIDKLWAELEPLLAGVENAYFAGGEPLMCDEHYKILDYWIKIGKTDIPINYTTNFALLNHKKAQVLEYWKQFKNVSVSASLDDSGTRAEYLRKGTNWNTIVKNRVKMQQECPNVYFEITPTISVYNVFHFPEFHLEWVEKEYIQPNDIRLNILTHQDYMSVRILPQKAKETIEVKYRKYLEKIINIAIKRNQQYQSAERGYNSLIEFMNAKDDTHLRSEFYDRVKLVDKVRKEDLLSVYPELKLLDYF